MYRLNTYPLLHMGFIHMILNVLALTPLLERFEAENGSLVTLLLYTGRKFAVAIHPAPLSSLGSFNPLAFGLIPGALYIFIERFLFRGNTSIQGARYVFTCPPADSLTSAPHLI